MKFPISMLLAMSLIACGEEEPKEEVDPLTVDDDGDGFSEEQGDCDDTNADLSPNATEICDEIDNDCDGDIDDDDSSLDASETGTTFYADTDGDGYGDADSEILACVLPEEGAAENMDDCDDSNADVSPDATEVCDETDNDCDGNIDDADDSLDASTGSTFYVDSDGDGEGDANNTVMACEVPEGAVENMTDCDDTDAALNNADMDGDGLATCLDGAGYRDCDDMNDTIGATDEDGDGYIACVDDCDDTNADLTNADDDGDGVTVCGGDCDDTDAAVGAQDDDGDGFSACLNDCDDTSATTYPGAGYNEADSSLCLNDADGDGYGDYLEDISIACVDIEMYDSWGDGWNGNAIEIYEDGVLTGTYANDSSYDANVAHTEQHCFDSATTNIDFVFVDGAFNSEVDFTIMDAADGSVLGMGEGSGSYDIIWEGTTFTDGDTFLNISGLTGGSDCDDADATTFGDDDGDGYTYCTNDCDDTDAALNPGADADADGYSTCDDCDDADAAVNPGATETWYDGVDSDCDGWNDYDADYDGDSSMEFSGSCSDATLMNQTDCEGAGTCDDGTSTDQSTCEGAGAVWTSAGNTWTATGYDCDDNDSTLLSLAMEADPTACYEDVDGDGYGDDSPSTSDMTTYGVIAGTDCYDGFSGSSIAPTVYPGAGYNEADTTLCYEDGDGDGYGDPDSYYGEEGTDCDDDDATLNPGVDDDMDGASVCVDCDDADATAQGGLLYDDLDGDGYGDMDDSGFLTCDLTALDSDSDGINDLSADNTDCDDDDATVSPMDGDGDGFSTCADSNGLVDCDDADEFTFPGAGFMEASFVSGDYTTYECLTDVDGDGYAYGFSQGCYTFDLTDSWGDGWNGGMNIEVFADGASVGMATVSGSSTSTDICVSGGANVEFVFNSGTYAEEIGGTIYDTDGTTVLGTLTGTGGWSSSSQTLDFSDGMSYMDGETFFTGTAVGTSTGGGTDADDNDSSVW